MSNENLVKFSITRHFAYLADAVFDAWLTPALARQFLFATAEGEMVQADIDARVGGTYTFVDHRDGEDVAHVGEYLEIERPRRLEFTFAVPQYDPHITRVTIEIESRGDGCDLTLTHEDVLPEWGEKAKEGWGMILDAQERVMGR